MFILDSLLVGGIRFVLDKVVAAAEAEASDDTALREQLLEAQMQLELGEMSEQEFAKIEADLLARIREVRGGHGSQGSQGSQGGLTISTPDVKIHGIEVEAYDPEK